MEPRRGSSDVVPLEDYWQECHSFDETATNDEEEEDLSKTPDEGEAEEEWLREAGFQNLVDSELTEAEEADFFADVLATLTARQAAVVRRRLDTVQRSKRNRRLPRTRHRADVRLLFGGVTPPDSLCTDGGLPEGLSLTALDTLPMRRKEVPPPPLPPGKSRSALPPLPSFLGHTGGFSLAHRTKGIDCESPTSVEVLRYESRNSTVQERDAYTSISSSEPFSLETGFQEVSSRINSVPDLPELVRQCDAAQMGDLCEADRALVRSLAVIEVAALLDAHGLVTARRRKPHAKKAKDNVVFGACLNGLLELDRRRCPGFKVPLIFQWILHHLHSEGLKEEGLMRLGGSVQKIQLLKSEIEKLYVSAPTSLENLLRQSSVHDVSVLLKQLVRHLPEPLLTNSHMDAFIQVPNLPNVQDQINVLNLLMLALPDSHRDLLQELLYFLTKVVEHELSNRMSLGNVAMIMAPNFFPPPRRKKNNAKSQDLATEVTVAAMTSKVTQLLIKYSDFLGSVPPELLAQARMQNRRSNNKHAKRMGRKNKGEKQKHKEPDNPAVIRVQAPGHPGSNVAVAVVSSTTAGEVVERVAEALELPPPRASTFYTEQQENRQLLQRPRTTSEPIVIRQRCLTGSKKAGENLKEHSLYFIRDNVGERRLDHNTQIYNIIGSGSNRFANGSSWEIRCHH